MKKIEAVIRKNMAIMRETKNSTVKNDGVMKKKIEAKRLTLKTLLS